MDADLARAIALSLQDARPQTRSVDPVPVPNDDVNDAALDPDAQFEADLARALKLSEQQSRQDTEELSPAAPAPHISNISTSIRQQTDGFLSERAQMEKARLERLSRLCPDLITSSSSTATNLKRSRDASPSSSDDEDEDVSSSKKYRPSSSERLKAADSPQLFWNTHEIRQTANVFVESPGDTKSTWRLSEIIGPKSELSLVIMASYCIDWPWLYSFFDPNTPVICVAQPDETGNFSMKEVLPGWIKTTPVLRGGRGCMHMKFMLLFYESGRLRIVINTANFVTYDWKEIENTSWIQDVPLRSTPLPIEVDPKPSPPGAEEDFGLQFDRVLRALGIESALRTVRLNKSSDIPLMSISDLRSKWDFSRVRARLVASIAGKHEGWPQVIRTGHTSLMKAIREIGARCGPDQRLQLEYQGSSIGSYSTQWVNEFFDSSRGESAETWLDKSRTARTKLPYPSDLSIIFPSARTVQKSRLGNYGGGTLFCRRNQWDGAKFPRELFKDSKSRRGGILMHTKMIIATIDTKSLPSSSLKASTSHNEKNTHNTGTDDDSSDIEEVDPHPAQSVKGWCYIGSHNFTPSAWGTLSGSAFNPVLNITNYEIGVIFPLESTEAANNIACWERPPRKYNLPEERAWIQEESHT